MTQPTCAICYEQTDGRLVPVCDSKPPHIFHLSCVQEWVDRGRDSCPLCRRSIVDLTFQNADTTAKERSIQFAARHENQEALIRLIENDEERAKAILFLPQKSVLTAELISQIENPTNFLEQITIFAASQPNIEMLEKWIQADPQLVDALNAPCENWDLLAEFCFRKAEKPSQVREEAVYLAAIDGNLEIIQKLILPIGGLGPLFDRNPRATEIRQKAIRLACDCRHSEVAENLIQNDEDRIQAVLSLSSDCVDLCNSIITDSCRESAILMAATQGKVALLQELIQNDEHRILALTFLSEKSPREPILSRAENRARVQNQAEILRSQTSFPPSKKPRR